MNDFPANPIDKPGYRLDFHDEFEGGAIDAAKWLPWYLPQWSSRERAKANMASEEGHLVLQIDADQPAWCPEFDGRVQVSSLQTGVLAGPVGSRTGQHRFNVDCVVREAQPTQFTYAPLYGYFEMRARAPRSAGNHAALWMIGIEDEPGHCSEICICELFGADSTPASSVVKFGVHPFHDARITDDFQSVSLPIDTAVFHVYAAEWTPEAVTFFVDNQPVGVVKQSPAYRMQFMLGLYELPDRVLPGGMYPKRFTIDYFRAYQPLGGYRAERK